MDLPVNYDECSVSMRNTVRDEYCRVQNNKCYHCDMSLNEQPAAEIMVLSVDESLFPPNFFKWPIHLHHDHNTGMTIGAVHCRCNAVLWQYHEE